MLGYPRADAIPGVDRLLEGKALPRGTMLLLAGPSGTGKTTYCQQFLQDGIAAGDRSIWISSSMTDKEFAGMFSRINSPELRFISLRPSSTFANEAEWAASLHDMLTRLRTSIGETRSNRQAGIRFVVDSLTQLKLLVKEEMLLKFLADLSFVAKEAGATAIITLNAAEDDRMCVKAGAVCDGIVELRADEIDGRLNRSARLVHIRGVGHTPAWTNFSIEKDGTLVFGERPVSDSAFSCVLCGKPITGTPVMEENFAFDTGTCAETYRKLTKIYGANISEIGLPSEAVNVSFFFVDIVGLSDPNLPVRKQIEKIRALNKFVASTEAFKKSEDKRFILPTGDGMAVGFLLNPELPLKLSIELHHKLAAYNQDRPAEDKIGVRIGLNSGPVFVVGDITDNQNVWGPGIILARRVMDLGDSGHILLGEKIAEELMSLNEKYKEMIRLVSGNFQIKHGQVIKVYSAQSNDFGNSALPLRLS
jgi:KaiC/GvpD/RAD55 family RecA-like ATPase/class 3 adenylate cyclase